MKPELVTATKLVRGGMSYGEAARELGLTRNQVAGACHRAGVRVAITAAKNLRRIARLREVLADPEVRKRQSRGAKRRWEDVGYQQRVSLGVKLSWEKRRAPA